MSSTTHVCNTCLYKRVKLDTMRIDAEDRRVYQLLQTMSFTANQAIRPDSVPKDLATPKYFKTALLNKTKVDFLIQDWWKMSIKKYNIPVAAKYDPTVNAFYVCKTPNGDDVLDGEWKHK